jgi:hypothetical protein
MQGLTSYTRRAAAALSLSLSLVALAACGADATLTEATPPADGQALTIAHFEITETQAVSGQASDATRQRTVITDAAAWTRFWASLKPDPNANGAAPAVDFSRDMVIAAAMPVQPSGGFRIAIESVTELSDRLEVQVVERSPARDCVLPPVVTRPFDVVQLPRRDKPVKFVERTVVTSCDPSAQLDTVRVAFGKSVDSHGVKVTLTAVPNDSRCPINAVCVWEGDAAVALRFEKNGQATDVTLHTSPKAGVVSTTVGGAEFRLVGLTPAPVTPSTAKESDYTAILAVR